MLLLTFCLLFPSCTFFCTMVLFSQYIHHAVGFQRNWLQQLISFAWPKIPEIGHDQTCMSCRPVGNKRGGLLTSRFKQIYVLAKGKASPSIRLLIPPTHSDFQSSLRPWAEIFLARKMSKTLHTHDFGANLDLSKNPHFPFYCGIKRRKFVIKMDFKKKGAG